MATVKGPAGDLFDSIDERLQRPRQTKKKSSTERESFGVKRNPRRVKFETKSSDEYNCNDIEMLIEREWRARGWKSNPPRFTMRDRKSAKEMIADHGAEDVAKTVEYMVQKWSSICRRYKVTGFPSMRVLYGYRHSWVPEAVEGLKHGATAGAEFDGEEDDIPSGSWG